MQNILEMLKEKKILIGFIFMCLVTVLSLTLYVTSAWAEEKYTCPKIDVEEQVKDEAQEEIIVDIKGAVAKPGVYKVAKKSIVNDLIKLAGGLTKDADTSNLNLSKALENEMVITVYTKDEVKNMAKLDSISGGSDEKDLESANSTNNKQSSLININTASESELTNIPGVGEAKAKLIIDYRTNCGKFTKKEDIKNIKGIGDKMYEQIAPYITV